MDKKKSKIKIKIKKNKKIITKFNTKKGYNEIDLFYNIRKRFIDLCKPKNSKEFKLYEMYSNILINIVFLKCSYQPKTEDFIRNFLKKNIKNFDIKMKNINK
jgi:hypothetical protein